ncbi:hypothetical protein GCM10010452_01060 [Crossiella cryophila]
MGGAGYADDVAACGGEFGDLLEGGVDVGGEGGGHGLDGDGMVAAYAYFAYLELAGFAARGEYGGREFG